MSAAFSEPLDNVLQAIDPRKRPANHDCFPRQCGDADLRVAPDESVRDWFARLVDGPLHGDAQACTVEDNLAIFLQFAWTKDRLFRYVRCQVLAVVGGTIEDAYLGSEGAQLRYLRLEYDSDPLASGVLFSHPVAHIHAQPSDAPRFALESVDDNMELSNLVLLDFFDFLYRNFCHAAWSQWADSVWRKAAPDADSRAHFETIRTFLAAEDVSGKRARLGEMLTLCEQWLPRIKRSLRQEKAEMPMNLAIDRQHLALFSYHL